VARAGRGDLSGPVLAILVTLILLAIGAAIIAYFTLFAGGTAQPVITVTGQPVAYKSGLDNAVVEVTVINTGSAPVTLGTTTRLNITRPLTAYATLAAPVTVDPGSTRVLTFTFTGLWGEFSFHRTVYGVLILRDQAGNTIGALEIAIRVVGGALQVSILAYNGFETYPVPDWANRGGQDFQLVDGYSGNALQFRHSGIGGGSQYYYNTRLDSYTSLWVSVKVYGSPTGSEKGLALISSDLNRLYAVYIKYDKIEVKSYNVERTDFNIVLASATIAGFNQNYWYTIVLRYSVTATAVNFQVWVYDQNGNQVASLTASSTSPNRFTPAYIGVHVDGPPNPATIGRFDDFIISTTDPR